MWVICARPSSATACSGSIRANGWKVISDVHLGDWGLQMGQLISEIEIARHRARLFRRQFHRSVSGAIAGDAWTIWKSFIRAPRPPARPIRRGWKRRAAPRSNLQAGRPGYRALWRHFVNVSERGLEREFGSLGVHFDLWNGESSVDALIAPMIEDLKARGLAQHERRRAGGAGRARRRQEADAAADPGQVGRRRALRHHRSRHHHRAGARI